MIYFVQIKDKGPIKIGYTKDLKKRISRLQTATPYDLNLLASIGGGWRLEKEIQNKFQHLNIKGEWYKPHDELLHFIANLEKNVPEDNEEKPTIRSGEKRRRLILVFMKRFIRENNYPPTVREIGEALGISSPSVVKYHLDVLEANGEIRRTNRSYRNIEPIYE